MASRYPTLIVTGHFRVAEAGLSSSRISNMDVCRRRRTLDNRPECRGAKSQCGSRLRPEKTVPGRTSEASSQVGHPTPEQPPAVSPLKESSASFGGPLARLGAGLVEPLGREEVGLAGGLSGIWRMLHPLPSRYPTHPVAPMTSLRWCQQK